MSHETWKEVEKDIINSGLDLRISLSSRAARGQRISRTKHQTRKFRVELVMGGRSEHKDG